MIVCSLRLVGAVVPFTPARWLLNMTPSTKSRQLQRLHSSVSLELGSNMTTRRKHLHSQCDDSHCLPRGGESESRGGSQKRPCLRPWCGISQCVSRLLLRLYKTISYCMTFSTTTFLCSLWALGLIAHPCRLCHGGRKAECQSFARIAYVSYVNWLIEIRGNFTFCDSAKGVKLSTQPI